MSQRTGAPLVAPALLVLAIAIAGCSGNSARHVHPGAMPAGGSFHGAWLSPQYGEMQLCVTGQHLVGTYEKNERVGRISGEVVGDVLWFDWEESRTYVPGNPVTVSGSGYFRLSLNEDNDNVITGEWGMGDDRTGGGPWSAVKRRRQGPDVCNRSLAAVTGSEVSWEEDEEEGEEEGSPEEEEDL